MGQTCGNQTVGMHTCSLYGDRCHGTKLTQRLAVKSGEVGPRTPLTASPAAAKLRTDQLQKKKSGITGLSTHAIYLNATILETLKE